MAAGETAKHDKSPRECVERLLLKPCSGIKYTMVKLEVVLNVAKKKLKSQLYLWRLWTQLVFLLFF